MANILAKIRQLLVGGVDWILYTVLSENIRKKISEMFSTKRKEKIKAVLNYGAHRKKQMQLKQLKNHMYTLGFADKGLEDLKKLLHEEQKPMLKRMIAWEIALWYANLYTKDGAKQALYYLNIAISGEKNRDQQRRIAVLLSESLLMLGETAKSQEVIQQQLEKEAHPDLYFAMANTVSTIQDKLYWINKVYASKKQTPITFRNEKKPKYDDIMMAQHAKTVLDDDKVTVILPAYNAVDGITIAIESILQQTWKNIELLIVDDCSSDETFTLAQSYAKKDERVKVFQTEKNSGPYVARNIGLQHATGKYITINDADDWSHEQKIETQVKHLQENPEVVANTSEHARLLEESLQFYRRGTPGKFIFPNMSSIMFRKEIVMDKLGYWNCVRFAGDGEFKRRLVKTFGPSKYVDLQSGPLSLPRQSANSLTGSSAFGYNGYFMGARKEYVESLEYHHAQSDSLYYPFQIDKPIFTVPRPMWPNKQPLMTEVDILLVADFRLIGKEEEKITEILAHFIKKSRNRKKIGLVQIYHYDLELDMDIHQSVRTYIANGDVDMFVYGETVQAKQVLILSEEAFSLKQKYIPTIDGEQIYVIFDENINETSYKGIQQHFRLYPSYIPFYKDKKLHIPSEMESTCAIVQKNWVDFI